MLRTEGDNLSCTMNGNNKRRWSMSDALTLLWTFPSDHKCWKLWRVLFDKRSKVSCSPRSLDTYNTNQSYLPVLRKSTTITHVFHNYAYMQVLRIYSAITHIYMYYSHYSKVLTKSAPFQVRGRCMECSAWQPPAAGPVSWYSCYLSIPDGVVPSVQATWPYNRWAALTWHLGLCLHESMHTTVPLPQQQGD